MRLLDTETGQFVEKDPEETVYVILSHTWDNQGEQTYEELKKIQERYKFTSRVPQSDSGSTSWLIRLMELPSKWLPQYIWHDTDLSPKILHACRVARENGYRYIWIDSCCIDKSSSAELSEAINSMYKWYGLSAVCYAYLADVPPGENHHARYSGFRLSRWFRRGWTLQELIAPFNVEFLSRDWAPIGSKDTLLDLVESVTHIHRNALVHVEPLDTFSVAQRLSWAANRETTRVEDRAYSLLGIFDINMPTLYGEGDRAFRRLQEQIMQHIPDLSLFSWGTLYGYLPNSQLHLYSSIHDTSRRYQETRHLFSPSPNLFRGCEGISTPYRGVIQESPVAPHHDHKIQYTSTPYGICTQLPTIPLTQDFLLRLIPHSEDIQLQFPDLPEGSQWYLALLGCEHTQRPRHPIGRVCYTLPSKTNADVEHIYTVSIRIKKLLEADLFVLLPSTIELCRLHTKLKTVYIPHPNRPPLPLEVRTRIRRQPYTTIKLVLSRGTRDTLRSRGYSVNLRDPNPAHPTIHWLELLADGHTITVEFRHTLETGGRRFTIDAEVKMMSVRSWGQFNSPPSSDGRDRHTISWSDKLSPWDVVLGREKVRLGTVGHDTLIVDLGLYFVGGGRYCLGINVLGDAQPAVEHQAGEVGRTKVDSLSGAINAGDSDLEDTEEADGCGTGAGVEARDRAATSHSTESPRDGDGALT